MTDELLTDEDYQKILQNRFKTPGIKFISASMKPLSLDVEGFMGVHLNLNITYKIGKTEYSQKFFIKTLPLKLKLRANIATDLNLYVKEIFLYDFLLKEYDSLGIYSSFAPKCFFSKNDETIVLEDMAEKQFVLAGRKNFFDLEHCKMSLKALAYFHGAAILYEEISSKKNGKTFRLNEKYPELFKENLFILGDDNGVGARYINSTLDCFIRLMDQLPETEEWKNKFIEQLEDYDISEGFNRDLPYRRTNCHGDLWSNNMLFRYDNQVPVDCCLVDFQLLRYHHPGYDAILVIYSNTRKQFRVENEEFLIQYYYDNLKHVLQEQNYDINDILPEEDFRTTVECFKSVALVQAAAGRTFTLLPVEFLNNAGRAEDDSFENLMFKDRPDLISEACKKDEQFRNIIFDDVYELHSCLNKSNP